MERIGTPAREYNSGMRFTDDGRPLFHAESRLRSFPADSRFWSGCKTEARVVISPAWLFEIKDKLENSGMDVTISVKFADGRAYQDAILDDIVMLPIDERNSLVEMIITGRGRADTDARDVIASASFPLTGKAYVRIEGPNQELVRHVGEWFRPRISQLPSFDHWTDHVELVLFFAGLAVAIASPFGLIFGGSRKMWWLLALAAGIFLCKLVDEPHRRRGPISRFAWSESVALDREATPHASLVRPKYLRCLGIAAWTILAAVLAQLLGTYLWEKVIK